MVRAPCTLNVQRGYSLATGTSISGFRQTTLWKPLLGRVIPLEEARESADLKPLLDLVAEDMQAINRIILDKAVSDVEMIPELAHHLIDSGGKRLRPMLTIAAAKLVRLYRGRGIFASPPPSSSCTPQRCCTTMSSMRAQRAAGARRRA